MEKFLLSLLLSFDELYVIYKKHIELAVLIAEYPGLVLLDGRYIFVCEHFGRYIKYLGLRIIAYYLNSDGLHEMSLSET